ncbi:imidazolonepropionase [Porphyromonas crevioricanis]|uniref:Imidazolonepropionase n=2 Tax=Porphyromonas crevioricanis TaxID=393921 RepID=A0A0A2FL41_9PORP|nr:imidazolonepropionase [Porphyromonas crevioricanis]KGN90760.1 imidazolonepropionase [Porphyromonas crevioricanis]KGN93997.1 imidazolonepropionase [Porphyromonas crevioricanis]SJZ62689.1 imidazolonepropionase [Porphyromonas crevioricanis]SQH72869.1 Imidazolonepropionase [Porphyromonas crevioricanis]
MSKNLFVKNIAQLVTCSGREAKRGAEAMNDIGLIEGPAAVVIREGKIAYAGLMDGVDPELTKGCDVYDAAGCCVLPGFVDSHTHLVFGGFREDEFQWRLRGDSYMSIMERGGGINNTMKATRGESKEQLKESARAHLDAMLAQGVTTVEAKSGYGMELEAELKQLEVVAELQQEHPMTIFPTYMGAHSTPPEYAGREDEFIDYLNREVLPAVMKQGIARCCDIFTEKGVFDHAQTRRYLAAAKEAGLKLKMHADEIVSFAGAELAAELGCLSADHLLQISDKGIEALANSQTVATLLPATAFSLKEPFAPGRKMIDNGCAVALASDLNPGSCFSCSMPLLIALATIYMNMTVEEAITALTINGAAALGLADQTGSIDEGKPGDLCIIRYPSYKFLSYHFAMNLVRATVKDGHVYAWPRTEL